MTANRSPVVTEAKISPDRWRPGTGVPVKTHRTAKSVKLLNMEKLIHQRLIGAKTRPSVGVQRRYGGPVGPSRTNRPNRQLPSSPTDRRGKTENSPSIGGLFLRVAKTAMIRLGTCRNTWSATRVSKLCRLASGLCRLNEGWPAHRSAFRQSPTPFSALRRNPRRPTPSVVQSVQQLLKMVV